MGLLDFVVGILLPYAQWIALILVIVAIYAVVRGALAGGGTTLGLVWLAVVLFLAGILLFLAGFLEDSLLAFAGGVLVAIGDGLHERRVVRRAHARMKG